MSSLTREMVEATFATFMAKDVDRVVGLFADDAVFIDPNYPQQRMVGKAAIARGVAWALGSMERPGVKIRHLWLDDGLGVVETDTHHVLKNGMELKFDQVFVFEVRGGKLTRMQSYVPYGPPGIAGLVRAVTGLLWRQQGKG
jgi:ketosteroid isomerase-like protein